MNLLKILIPYRLYCFLGRFFKKTVNSKRTRFSGWDMMTASQPPWESYRYGKNLIFEGQKDFQIFQNDLVNDILADNFRLTQFPIKPIVKTKELMWRHFIVIKSLNLAIKNNHHDQINLVECGVCDGLASYFVLKNMTNQQFPFLLTLYDSWAMMKPDYLTESENSRNGKYNYLNIENTKRNLHSFKKNIEWNQGYIPKVFLTGKNPSHVNWLHIDLNSAIPTKESLNFFSSTFNPGSIILFDDYSWPGHEDARYEIDSWSIGQKGFLLPFPTGQAMFVYS